MKKQFFVATALGVVLLGGGGVWMLRAKEARKERSAFYLKFLRGETQELSDKALKEGGFPAAAAKMLQAQKLWEAGEEKKAKEFLRDVANDASDPLLADWARLWQGTLLAQEAPKEALDVLSHPRTQAFAPLFAERRADVLFLLGKRPEPQKSWQEAAGQAQMPWYKEFLESKAARP